MVTVTPHGGLFGPRSITWRVHTEPLGPTAAVRAFQLQALHPRTIRGIAQNFLLDDPEEARARLRRVQDFVTVRTFGTLEQAEQAAERVRRAQARLVGLDPDTGTLFRVHDEENLRWVHCAEVSSYLEIALRAGLPLTPAEQDAYVAEQRLSARLVGLRDVPGDTAELAACLDDMRPRLAATPEARDALRRGMTPRPSLRPALRSHTAAGALAYATLPGWAREMYGHSGDAAAEHAAGAVLKALRRAAAAMPERLVAPEVRAARALMRPAADAAGADVAA
ncbi:oxygenase MpaB family protein [Nonomuraea terrae]|nr:oxygenase MpaB family protein [Nonomuraea terrae]